MLWIRNRFTGQIKEMIIEKVVSDRTGAINCVRCSGLFEAAGIDVTKAPVLAFVGAGGKTTMIMEMSAELEQAGIEHLVMTTTHMWPFMESGFRRSVGDLDHAGKLTRPEDSIWRPFIGKMPILIEADGSRGLPLKLPAAHEPVIPIGVTHVIGVIGASCLGMPVKDVCFRYELLKETEQRGRVTYELLERIIKEPAGIQKSVDDRPFILVINQMDNMCDRTQWLQLYPKIGKDVDLMLLAGQNNKLYEEIR